jgi:tRNA-dihydrouridine synthase A
MQDAVAIPVTVKHRIGVDRRDDYGFVRDFVGALYGAGCRVFIVHARSAWLKGLSPKENREVPPLDYSRVLRLKHDFPSAEFVLNGGISSLNAVREHVGVVDGVMLGRAAYHDPYLLAGVDRALFGGTSPAPTREAVVLQMTQYLQQQTRIGTAPRHIVRHMLGLFQGLRGARQWRRTLSDADSLQRYGADVLKFAFEAVRDPPALLSAVA